MNVIELPINELSNDPANVRRHTDAQVVKLMAMLRRFGQQLPLVVDANNIVRVGNARLEAMRRLGWERVQVVRTDLAGVDLTAFAVADNRSSDPDAGSTFDPDALAATLMALKAEDYDIAAVGYSLEEFAALLPGPPAADPTAPDDFQSFDEDIATEHECPRCKFKWSGKSSSAEAA